MKYLPFCLVLLFPLLSIAQSKTWSLKACIDYAGKNNLSLQRSQVTNELTWQNVEQTRGNRIPSVSGSASQGFNFGRSIDPFSNQFVQQTVRSNRLSIDGSLLLFNGFQNTRSIEQNKQAYQAGVAGIEKTRNDLYLAVASSYLQILLSSEQLNRARMQLASTVQQLERNRKMVNAGTATEGDLAQLQAQEANDELIIANIQNQLLLAKLQLCQQMQLPFTEDFAIEPEQLDAEIISPDTARAQTIFATAKVTMPQIKEAALRSQSSFTGVKVSQGSRLPRLTLNAGISTLYSSQSSELAGITGYNSYPVGFVNGDPTQPVLGLSPVFERRIVPLSAQLDNNLSQYISFNLFVPILTNRQVRTTISRAKINYHLAQNNEQIIHTQLRQDVEKAAADLQTSRTKLLALQRQVAARTVSFTFAEKRYMAGVLNNYDYLLEKNNLNRAQLELIQAQYEYYFQKKVVDFYLGLPID